MTTTVLNLQRRLLAFGFNPGTPDGARARLREKGAPTHTPTGMATSPAGRNAIRAHERNVLTAYSGPATGGEPGPSVGAIRVPPGILRSSRA